MLRKYINNNAMLSTNQSLEREVRCTYWPCILCKVWTVAEFRIDRIHCLQCRSLPRSAPPPIASSVVDFLKFRLFLPWIKLALIVFIWFFSFPPIFQYDPPKKWRRHASARLLQPPGSGDVRTSCFRHRFLFCARLCVALTQLVLHGLRGFRWRSRFQMVW